jgi:hypothetical protein
MRFLSLGVRQDSVYVPPVPTPIQELRDRITHALQAITANMLHRVRDEFDYRLDVCCVTQSALQAITENMLHRVRDEFDYRVDVCSVTQGAHIEGLQLSHEKLGQFPLLTEYVVPA